MPSIDFPASKFWNYSSQAWNQPDVERACLELQDQYEFDINILLYCCWLGDQHLCINEDDLQVILDATKPWQTMIKPMRDSRKMMQQQLIAMPSSMVEKTIKNIKEMELNSEHMCQLALEKALKLSKLDPQQRTEVECSLHNLNIYLLSVEPQGSQNDTTKASITALLNAIYQDEESVQLALMNQAASA